VPCQLLNYYVFHCLRDHTVPTIVSHLPTLISLVGCQRANEGCDRYENEGDHGHTRPALPIANVHTHTNSDEEAAMVDGGTKVQMPISRRAHSRPLSAPGG